MANRLSKIYTRTGDDGKTGAADGSRFDKDNALIQAQGDVDELNSVLGMLATHINGETLELIRGVQHRLFDIGGEISLGEQYVPADVVAELEQAIDAFNNDLTPLKEFILPGGNETGAWCHLARAVCRRAERSMVSLNRNRPLNPVSLAYINRLSDFLFVLARVQNGVDEIYWQSARIME